jgi:hypothetical protein
MVDRKDHVKGEREEDCGPGGSPQSKCLKNTSDVSILCVDSLTCKT